MDWRQIRLDAAQQSAAALAPRFAGLTTERLIVAHLGADRGVCGITEHSCDRRLSVRLPLRRIASEALGYDARGLIIAHNHPGGDPQPSDGDLEATRRMAAMLAPLEIRLVDHLVFAGPRWTSFRNLDLL